jgi:formate-dependent nitrite reductase membrane component NrfD
MSSHLYDQLISDLRSDFRPQREWGEGRGVLLVVGHFLVGIAGGAWLMGTIYDVSAALVVGFVLGGLGGLAHLLFLGRPERAFNMMRHWRTSWISRGFYGLSLFLVGGVLYLPTMLFSSGGAWTGVGLVGEILALIGMVIIIGYMGFAYTASKGVPFWSSPLHPALYIAYALRGGIATLLVVAAASGRAATSGGLLPLWIGVTATVALFFVLELQGAVAGGNAAARRSVREILAGRVALVFYGGTLMLGIIVPVLLLSMPMANSPATMALIGLASAAGDFFMKLSTVRAGVYLPLMLPQQRHRA